MEWNSCQIWLTYIWLSDWYVDNGNHILLHSKKNDFQSGGRLGYYIYKT